MLTMLESLCSWSTLDLLQPGEAAYHGGFRVYHFPLKDDTPSPTLTFFKLTRERRHRRVVATDLLVTMRRDSKSCERTLAATFALSEGAEAPNSVLSPSNSPKLRTLPTQYGIHELLFLPVF
jgi:hypothetical protein